MANNPKRHQTVPKALFIVFSDLTEGEGLVEGPVKIENLPS